MFQNEKNPIQIGLSINYIIGSNLANREMTFDTP